LSIATTDELRDPVRVGDAKNLNPAGLAGELLLVGERFAPELLLAGERLAPELLLTTIFLLLYVLRIICSSENQIS
jgi:hypothetical protein